MKIPLPLVFAACVGIAAADICTALEVYDEQTLHKAVERANTDHRISRIVFKRNARIVLKNPVTYTGKQALKLFGNGTVIDGSSAGGFIQGKDLTARTEDGVLVFSTAANLGISDLTIVNSASRGIVVNVPHDAAGEDITITLNRVTVMGSALYGLHVDDNADAFDNGDKGSAIGIKLRLIQSSFTGNGTGAIDFDGIRVDERGDGGIEAFITNTRIHGNGGDGIELDEGGNGDVKAVLVQSSISGNGFYNSEDLDDGFDIDETGAGDVEVSLVDVKAESNMDEGLDFDEKGSGDMWLLLNDVSCVGNKDEGIKVVEKGFGNLEALLERVEVLDGGDDGIQFAEYGEGKIDVKLTMVTASNNAKYGVWIDQRLVKNEIIATKNPGYLMLHKTILSGNGWGDDIKLHNIIAE